MVTQKKKRLLDELEELKADIVVSSTWELAEKYGVSRDYISDFIKTVPELYKLFKSEERKEYLYKNRNTKRQKYKDDDKKVQLFKKRLDENGVIALAEAVIKLAVKECDRYFFTSGRYDFWEQFTSNRKSADYYLNLMGR